MVKWYSMANKRTANTDCSPEAQDAYNEWFYASCLQGDDLPQVPAEFGSDVDLIALEVMADRLAGHRTSYLLA